MYTRRKHHNTFSNVAAGAKAIAEIPKGPTLFESYIVCFLSNGNHATVANMKTEVESVTFKDGSEEIVSQWSGADLLDLEKALGNTNADGFIPIYHVLPNLTQKTEGVSGTDGEQLAYGTKNSGKLTVEVKLTSGATLITSMSCRGVVSDESRPRGQYVTLRKHNRAHASTGVQEISDLPKGSGRRMYLAAIISKDTISSFNLKVNGIDVDEDISKEEQERALVNAGRSVVSGKFMLDFMRSNVLRYIDFLAQGGVNELRLDVNWSTAPTSFEIAVMQLEGIGENNAV